MMYQEMPDDSTEVKILKADIVAMKEKLPKLIKQAKREARVESAEMIKSHGIFMDKTSDIYEVWKFMLKECNEIISTNKESK